MIPYTLVRANRKSVAIYITEDAVVEIRAPLKMPVADIEKFILSKEKWITAHLTERKQRSMEKAAFMLDYGDIVPISGRQYTIIAKEGNRAGFNGEQLYLPPGLTPDRIKHTIVRIYKAVAKKLLTERTAQYAKQMSVKPAAIKISSAKTRWGSCSGKNSLNFSWRLIMADNEVIDYVVVHELAHIKEHNHSPRFWAIVESIIPDYLSCKKRLNILQDKLSRENWE
jgi:predicted metal-dependent hydrolase